MTDDTDDDGDPLDNLVDDIADERSIPPNDDEDAADGTDSTGGGSDNTGGGSDSAGGDTDRHPDGTADDTAAGTDGDESAAVDPTDDAPSVEDVTHEVTGPGGEPPPDLDGDRSGPLGEMADEFERRREERDAEPDDDLFESVDVGDVDSEALWEQVSTDEPTPEPEPDAPEVRVIAKSKYCQRCEYFTDPPEIGCTHDGTTIRSEASMDEFEVVDCPKILEDERLERTR